MTILNITVRRNSTNRIIIACCLEAKDKALIRFSSLNFGGRKQIGLSTENQSTRQLVVHVLLREYL